MVGIIAAMAAEINELKGEIANLKIEKVSGMDFCSGTLYGKEVVACMSGVGKVFAAMCSQTMILKYHPEKIIHIGIAGSLCEDLGVHDLAIAEAVVQHDVDLSAFGDPKGRVEGLKEVKIPCEKNLVSDLVKCAKDLNIKYKVGTIVSGDQFISDSETKKNLAKDFDAIAVEMEGASTGQVCFVNGVDFAVLRAISDGSTDSTDDYGAAKQSASDVSMSVIKKYLQM